MASFLSSLILPNALSRTSREVAPAAAVREDVSDVAPDTRREGCGAQAPDVDREAAAPVERLLSRVVRGAAPVVVLQQLVPYRRRTFRYPAARRGVSTGRQAPEA
jgi:hypothetical protein